MPARQPKEGILRLGAGPTLLPISPSYIMDALATRSVWLIMKETLLPVAVAGVKPSVNNVLVILMMYMFEGGSMGGADAVKKKDDCVVKVPSRSVVAITIL